MTTFSFFYCSDFYLPSLPILFLFYSLFVSVELYNNYFILLFIEKYYEKQGVRKEEVDKKEKKRERDVSHHFT